MNRSQVKQPCGEVNGDQSSWTDAHQLTDEFRSSPGGGQYPHPPLTLLFLSSAPRFAASSVATFRR
jgi:hypothetical protein